LVLTQSPTLWGAYHRSRVGHPSAVFDYRTSAFSVGAEFIGSSTSAPAIWFSWSTNSNQVGYINVGPSSVTYATSSDYRLKENVVPMVGAIDRLKGLKPIRFTWKAHPELPAVDGFLAHEVTPYVPEAINGEKDAVRADGSINPQGIDQAKLTPLLTAALQEAVARIEALEAEVAALKAG